MNPEMLLILLIAVSVAVFVGEPLIRRSASDLSAEAGDPIFEQLSLQKETLYTAIRDLEFDFHTGKVDQKDYTKLRQHLETEALQILRQLDDADPNAGLESDLEQQILALRQQTPGQLHAACLPPCPRCGVILLGGENFCPSCGRPLLSA
jgi:zinc-ribbon domain